MSNTCPHCGGEIDDWGDSLFHILKHREQIADSSPEPEGSENE